MKTAIICIAVLLCMSCSQRPQQVQTTEDVHTSTLHSELQRVFGRVEIHDTIQPLIIDSAGKKRHTGKATARHTHIDINLTAHESDTTQGNTHKVNKKSTIVQKNAEKHTILHFLPTIVWLILLLSLLLWRIFKKGADIESRIRG